MPSNDSIVFLFLSVRFEKIKAQFKFSN